MGGQLTVGDELSSTITVKLQAFAVFPAASELFKETVVVPSSKVRVPEPFPSANPLIFEGMPLALPLKLALQFAPEQASEMGLGMA